MQPAALLFEAVGQRSSERSQAAREQGSVDFALARPGSWSRRASQHKPGDSQQACPTAVMSG
jgi:uncharacterized GH25 family protein